MISRVPGRGGLLAGAAALLLAAGTGCGTLTATDKARQQLTLYSSLPLQGPDVAEGTQMLNGERLAIYDAGGQVGRYPIYFFSLDDANPASGATDASVTANLARTAAQDRSAMAYIGDLSSTASVVSAPLINEAGIPQISPLSGYVGLTQSVHAGLDEPDRFYPTGVRTLVRLVPNDAVEGAALTSFMAQERVRRLDVMAAGDFESVSLAAIVSADARGHGMAIVSRPAQADAVFYAGPPSAATAALWRSVRRANPGVALYGSSALATPVFTRQLGTASSKAYIADPVLPMRYYPAAAQRVAAEYRARFGAAASAYALYGYEAVSLALTAIRDAGARAGDRRAVTRALFHTTGRDSVLGRYSIDPAGDTTVGRYAIDRVRGGVPTFYRLMTP